MFLISHLVFLSNDHEHISFLSGLQPLLWCTPGVFLHYPGFRSAPDDNNLAFPCLGSQFGSFFAFTFSIFNCFSLGLLCNTNADTHIQGSKVLLNCCLLTWTCCTSVVCLPEPVVLVFFAYLNLLYSCCLLTWTRLEFNRYSTEA